jgi:hypothetical protein
MIFGSILACIVWALIVIAYTIIASYVYYKIDDRDYNWTILSAVVVGIIIFCIFFVNLVIFTCNHVQ